MQKNGISWSPRQVFRPNTLHCDSERREERREIYHPRMLATRWELQLLPAAIVKQDQMGKTGPQKGLSFTKYMKHRKYKTDPYKLL